MTPTTTMRTAEDSPEPKEYVLALGDVLGFTERVTSTSLATLIPAYKQLIGRLGWSTRVPVFHVSEGSRTDWATRSIVFSDSVRFWSRIGPESIDMLLTGCARIIAEAAKCGWPLRGVVAIGECVIDEADGIFVGAGIIRALKGEKSQEWIGFGIDDSATTHPVAGPMIPSTLISCDMTCQ